MHGINLNDQFKSLDINDKRKDVREFKDLLASITAELKDSNARSQVHSQSWLIFDQFLDLIISQEQNSPYSSLAADIFILLRNACAGSELNQQHILNTPNLLDNISLLFRRVKSEEKPLLYGMQYFGNFVSGSTETSMKCKLEFVNRFGFELIVDVFSHSKSKHHAYAATMVMYNCILRNEIKTLFMNSKQLVQLSKLLLEDITSEQASEYSLWIIREMLSEENFLPIVYEELDVQSRYAVIDIVHDLMVGKETVGNFSLLHERNFSYLLNKLSKHLLDIFKLAPDEELTDSENSRPLEVRKLLQVFCEPFSSEPNDFTNAIKQDLSLLETLLDTLRTLHLLAKSDIEKYGSLFKPISSLRLPEATDKDALEASPVYGFKRDLVRLVGNMCSQCKANQDLVGHLDGIPLLLDCCHIDARNPYIMQWAIFAVRCATNGHQSNQSVIAGMVDHGSLKESPLLNELGFTFENGKLTNKKV